MITILVLASAIGCVPVSDTKVVGVWESESKSRGGIGQTIQFKANGEVLTSMSVLVDEFYRTEAGKLFVAEDRNALAAATDGSSFTVRENVLRQFSGKGHESEKTRVGADRRGADSIVGEWRYRHYTGGIAFERYTEDGRMQFRLPMTSQPGCFNALGGAMEIITPKSKAADMYAITGDSLTLTGEDGQPSKYRRTDPWYPLDQIDYQKPK